MVTFNFNHVVLNAGTTFIFGSWIYIVDGSSSFDSYLTDTMSPEAPSHNYFDKTVNDSNEILLPELADKIEKLSVTDATSIRSTFFELVSIYSETTRTQLPLGLRNAATLYLAIMRRKITARIAEQEATTCREAPIFNSYPDSNDSV